MSATESLWVVIPAAQRRDGSWIDDTLVTRTAEAKRQSAVDGGFYLTDVFVVKLDKSGRTIKVWADDCKVMS